MPMFEQRCCCERRTCKHAKRIAHRCLGCLPYLVTSTHSMKSENFFFLQQSAVQHHPTDRTNPALFSTGPLGRSGSVGSVDRLRGVCSEIHRVVHAIFSLEIVRKTCPRAALSSKQVLEPVKLRKESNVKLCNFHEYFSISRAFFTVRLLARPSGQTASRTSSICYAKLLAECLRLYRLFSRCFRIHTS